MKKNFTFLMHPDTHRRLKAFASANGLTLGEGVHLLLDRHETEQRQNRNTVTDFLRGGVNFD